MSINRINTQYQNYAASGAVSVKKSSSPSTFDTFQKEVVSWEKKLKNNIDKEQENDINGSIQMSEKQWRSLMKKVDSSIDTLKDDNKKQEQEGKKQLKKKKLTRKDTIAVSLQTDKAH